MSKLFRKYPSEIRKTVQGIYIIDEIFLGYLMSEYVYDKYRNLLNKGKTLWEVLPPLPYEVCYFETKMPFNKVDEEGNVSDVDTEEKLCGMLWDYRNPSQAFQATCVDGTFSTFILNMHQPLEDNFQLPAITEGGANISNERMQFACHEIIAILGMSEIIEKQNLGGEKKYLYTGKHGVDYKILKVNPMFKTKYAREGKDYVYKGIVRQHEVSGHDRHYANGKVVRVKAHKRGNPERGIVHKKYHITTEIQKEKEHGQ